MNALPLERINQIIEAAMSCDRTPDSQMRSAIMIAVGEQAKLSQSEEVASKAENERLKKELEEAKVDRDSYGVQMGGWQLRAEKAEAKLEKCSYCGGEKRIETDNNGPIVDCPLCGQQSQEET